MSVKSRYGPRQGNYFKHQREILFGLVTQHEAIPVTVRSKASVYGRSITWMAGSNSEGGINVYTCNYGQDIGLQLCEFITSTTYEALRPGRFTPGETITVTQWRGVAGHRASMRDPTTSKISPRLLPGIEIRCRGSLTRRLQANEND